MGVQPGADQAYFEWLCRQCLADPGSRQWEKILIQMFETEFVWLVSNDGSRLGDGLALRDEFLDEMQITVLDEWLDQPCSFLEMLVALARRLDFQTDVGVVEAFAELMGNMGFTQMRVYHPPLITEILERVIFRTYSGYGVGGLFPVRNPTSDMRQRELWFQMMDYIRENHPT